MNEIADTEASNAIFYAELDTKLATMTPYARQKRLNELDRLMRRHRSGARGLTLAEAVEQIALRDKIAAKAAADVLIEQMRSGAVRTTGIPVYHRGTA
jgi:hypothetical protein